MRERYKIIWNFIKNQLRRRIRDSDEKSTVEGKLNTGRASEVN